MKTIAVLFALSLTPTAFGAICSVTQEGAKIGTLPSLGFNDVRVGTYEFKYADGSKGAFQVYRDHVEVQGFKRKQCKEEKLFAPDENGRSYWNGIKTRCPLPNDQALTVFCVF